MLPYMSFAELRRVFDKSVLTSSVWLRINSVEGLTTNGSPESRSP
jgi:hypothetical protein